MESRDIIDVSALVETRANAGSLAGLVGLLAAVTFLDGLDSNLISFASPYFAKEYGLNAVQTGNVFSMHLLGTVLGGFLFAYLGDRIGRRPAILWATLIFGALTTCFYWVSGYPGLLTLRFLDGIPLGGLLPLVFALGIEYSPYRFRASVVTIIMVGYSLGTAIGGPLANALAPGFGWKSIFIVGGSAGLASAALLFVRLPESIRFLVSKGGQTPAIRAILQRTYPSLHLAPDVDFHMSDEPGKARNFRPQLLFHGRLAKITPLVWLAYTLSSFTVFLIVNWTPVFFESLGYTRAQAATAASLNSLAGALAGVCLMRFTDKRGPGMMTVMPIATAILLLYLGLSGDSGRVFLLLSVAMGGVMIGGHFGMHSICGLYYPSAYRSNGAGWAISVAKIGAVAGPIAGGQLLAAGFSVRTIYALLAIAPVLFAICSLALGRVYSQQSSPVCQSDRPKTRVITVS